MKIDDWYKKNWEHNLQGRYITLEMILPLLDGYADKFETSLIGMSEQGRSIPVVKIGKGAEVILAWSQMHGNESTTTKALFDLLKFLNQGIVHKKEVANFLDTYTLYMVPILNPDGAELYTRENANGIDLNRDFQNLSQLESRYLRSLFDQLKPSLCLNMHDQRTIYGLSKGKPATVSFLSPAADGERSLTPARQEAMKGIVKMNKLLQGLIPGQVGRYDDSFNAACVGDSFQMNGVPTILFEAGHFPGDYQRENTRRCVFYALLALFEIIGAGDEHNDFEKYFQIPENKNNFRDVILRNVVLPNYDGPVDISIQYLETLTDDEVDFKPFVDDIGSLSDLIGHREIDLNFSRILTKSSKLLTVNVKVPKLFDINEKRIVFFE